MKWKEVIFVKVILLALMSHPVITMEARQFGFGMNRLLVPRGSLVEPECECGKITRKIDDERLAKVKIAGGRLPWLAELVLPDDRSGLEDTEDFQLCFGTVVSLQTVLFPASCIQRNFYSNTGRSKPKVKLLGTENWKEALQDISNIRVHPSYRKRFDNDLAIVRLRKRIDFNETGIVPICLPPETMRYLGGGYYPDTKLIEVNSNSIDNQSELYERQGEMDRAKKPSPSFVLDYSVTRTWFYRKAAGFDYVPHYGRFSVDKMNETNCQTLFPEMLQSKVGCVQQREVKNIAKQNEQFFQQLELGMPIMLSNTTIAKGKPQPATSKYSLEGIRAPGRNGVPMLEMRENAMALLKVEDYVRWIKESSGSINFCKE